MVIAAPHIGYWIPGNRGREIANAVIGDAMLLIGLLMLGSEFWDKLRALFVRRNARR